jgi:hypothetical protein
MVIGLMWGLPWSVLFAWQVHMPLGHVVPLGLVGGVAFGAVMAGAMAVFERFMRTELTLAWFRAKEPPIVDDGGTPYRAQGHRPSHVDPRVACPWCGDRALTRLRKSFLGPAMTVRCASCTKPVSISGRSMFAVLPFLASLVASMLAAQSQIWAAAPLLIVGGFAVTIVLHDRVRLVRR